MNRFLPYVSAVILVTVGVLIGSTLMGNNAVAQKVASITGMGTQDHLAKWLNNNGGLGNSAITEHKQGNVTIAGSIKFPDGSISILRVKNVTRYLEEELAFHYSAEKPVTVMFNWERILGKIAPGGMLWIPGDPVTAQRSRTLRSMQRISSS